MFYVLIKSVNMLIQESKFCVRPTVLFSCSAFYFREYLAQKEGEIRFRGATQPSQYGQTQVVPAGVNRPTSEYEESSQPITAALGSHRIAELKSQLHKNKVNVI